MGVEILESDPLEIQNHISEHKPILPYTIETVKNICKNPLGIITACIFLCAAVFLSFFDFFLGLLLIIPFIFITISEITALYSAVRGKLSATHMLKISYFFVSLITLSISTYYYILYYNILNLDITVPKLFVKIEFPQNFQFLNNGDAGLPIFMALIFFCNLVMWRAFSLLNRCNKDNIPYCKSFIFFMLAEFIIFLISVYFGLEILGITNFLSEHTVCSQSFYEMVAKSTISFSISVYAIFQGIRCLTFYIKLRKVKYAVFKQA